jgi:hypothetical protein
MSTHECTACGQTYTLHQRACVTCGSYAPWRTLFVSRDTAIMAGTPTDADMDAVAGGFLNGASLPDAVRAAEARHGLAEDDGFGWLPFLIIAAAFIVGLGIGLTIGLAI